MNAAERASWATIDRQLAELAQRHGPLGFWLRDDDATRPTPALDRLLSLAAAAGAPLALAVIPALATPQLAERLAREPGVAVLQHGFRHGNHAPAGMKKAELGAGRAAEAVSDELQEGRRSLASFSGVLPVLVPPWNRIDPAIAAVLPSLGFRGLSLFGERDRNPPAALRHFNTHLDPVAWRDGKRFMGREAALNALSERLRRMIEGPADPREPTGILTHHLIHDDETLTFLANVLQYISRSRSCRWLSAETLLAND